MNKRVSECFMAVAVAWLAGCATPSPEPAQLTERQQELSVMQKIDDSTKVAVNAQRELALTADAKVQHDVALRRRMLTDVVDYDFYGDVEDILRQISMRYAYAFRVYGKRPPEGVNANVFVRKQPVVEVLKQIGYSLTDYLDIRVVHDAIELHYKER